MFLQHEKKYTKTDYYYFFFKCEKKKIKIYFIIVSTISLHDITLKINTKYIHH